MVVQSARIGDALAGWVGWILRVRLLVVLVCLVGAAACLNYAARNLGINTDTADMISAALPWRVDILDFRETFAVRDRNLIVVIDAPSPEQADRVAAVIADRVLGAPELFQSGFFAGHGSFFERHGLMYLSPDELETLADRLAAAQPLLGRLQQRFDGTGLVEVLIEAQTAAQGQAALPDTLYRELAVTFAAAAGSERRPVSWQRLLAGDEGGADRARSLVLVRPVQDFTRVQSAGPAIAFLREAAAELVAAEPGEVTVRLTGSVALEHEELVSVTRSAGLAGLLALAMVGAVLFWALRSLVLVAIAVVTLVVGLAGTAAFAAAAVGHLNLLSVAFAVLYIGLGIDFIIHMSLRLRELTAQGLALDDALVETARSVGSSLLICSVTTAAAFYAFIPTPFQGVSELGLISGTGMFVSLFASLTLLPALASLTLPWSRGRDPARWFGARVGQPVTRRPRFVLLAAGIVLVVSVALFPGLRFDSNPVNLRDPGTESVRTLTELADGSEVAMLQLVAIAPDHDTAVAWARRLGGLEEVSEVRTAESLVPGAQQEKLWILDDIALLLGRDFAAFERRPPQPEELAGSLATLAQVLHTRDDRDETRRVAAAIDTLLARADSLPDDERERLLVAVDEDLLLNLPPQLARLEAGLEARPFGVDDLPSVLTERWFAPDGRELIEIVPAGNMLDDADTRRFVEAVHAVVPRATGLPVVHVEASATVVRAFQLAFVYALAMVFLILFMFLRDLKDSLLVLVPIVFAAAATAGLTVVLGIPFNFANVIALPLLMGVGVDSSIHIVHRMRNAPPADGRLHATSTARAVFASGLTTIASFGNLAFASHLGMASMGKLLTLGMAVSLVATLILLPALLNARRPAVA
jgi:uncharacterized protein